MAYDTFRIENKQKYIMGGNLGSGLKDVDAMSLDIVRINRDRVDKFGLTKKKRGIFWFMLTKNLRICWSLALNWMIFTSDTNMIHHAIPNLTKLN